MALCVLVLVVVGVGQLGRSGYSRVTNDPARYLYVGRTVLDGHLPRNVSGGFYSVRSPVFGVYLAAIESLDHLRPHLTATDALDWLDAAAATIGEEAAIEQFAEARPVVGVTSPAVEEQFLARLGTDDVERITVGPGGY